MTKLNSKTRKKLGASKEKSLVELTPRQFITTNISVRIT